jgi:hypothetical protein
MEAVLTRSVPRTTTAGRARWAGLAITGLAVLFLVFDSAVKVLKLAPAIEATTQLGYPASAVALIGLIELVCLAVYLVPRSAIAGAVLLSGYLGGAIASQLRAGHPLFSHTLFPIYVAALVWAGLYLRDRRVRALLAPAE